MIEILLFSILFILVCLLAALVTHTWLAYRQTNRIIAYLDALGEMIGDTMRELIESQGVTPKKNDQTKGKGK